LDIPQPLNRVRRIPLDAFETIYQLRLRELFGIIREQAEAQTSLGMLNSGVVLTGGGALFEPAQKILREEMEMSVRVGSPINMVGAVTGLENPRYSCLWGALKIADFYLRCDTENAGGAFNRLLTGVDGVMTRMKRAFGDFRGSFRF
ncbi:MAG: rod shape-determining protein, partial [Lentisphaeria bacterium]|nr:rod shape-determining protein [Lentisphaeria bacterium]